MQHDSLPPLPPGYVRITGQRNPPASMGDKLFVQLRNGLCPAEPWPVAPTRSGTTRWIWGEREDDFDIVAIRKV